MDIFDEARSKFLSRLSAADRPLLEKCNTAEALRLDLEQLNAQTSRDSKLRKLLDRTGPFFKGLNQYASALDIFSSVKPEILSLIWGSARLILQFALVYSDLFEKLVSLLEDLSRRLGVFEIYAKLYPSHGRLRNSLARAYAAFLDVTLETKKLLGERPPKKGIMNRFISKHLRKLLKHRFLDAKDKLDRMTDEVTQESDIAEKVEHSTYREERRIELKHVANREMLGWLDEVDVETRFCYLGDVHEPGTGTWFVQEDHFKSWAQEKNAALWLHAKPGAGKSVMAHTVIQHLQQAQYTADSTVIYYFFDYKNTQSQSASKVIQTLLANLCRLHPEIQEIVENLFQRYRGTNLVCPIGTLRDTLRSCLHNLPRTFVVIDALDECSEPVTLIEILKPLLDGHLRLNMFFTSRKLENITKCMNHLHVHQCTLSTNSHSQDISQYVRSQLESRIQRQEMRLRDPELRSQIEKELCSKADGMFQWVNCQIDALSKCISDRQICQKLKTLPATLDETYVRALEGLFHEFPDERQLLRRLFFWLVHALRPMDVIELSRTMAFDARTNTEDPSAVPTDPEDILRYSAGLFNFTDTKGTVGLSHYSVKEFLTSEKILTTSVSDFFAGDEISQLQVLENCFSLLCTDNLRKGQCQSLKAMRLRKEKSPLLDYAARYWLQHYKLVEESINSDLDQRILAFFTQAEHAESVLSWQQIVKSFDYGGLPPRLHIETAHPRNPICYAAEFGVWRLTKQLIEKGYDVSGTEDDSPIGIATRSFRTDMPYIEKLAEICSSTQGGRGGGQLAHFLAKKGGVEHWPLIKKLISHGADPKYQAAAYPPWLMAPTTFELIAANAADSEEMIGFVAGFAQDVNEANIFRNGRSETNWPPLGPPLQQACLRGNLNVARKLIDLGADLEFSECELGTPLQAAARGKHSKIVRMLLDHGCDPNTQGGALGTPLQAAAWAGDDSIAKLLLDRSANVNASGGIFGDALTAAICKRNILVAEMLLQNGAGIKSHCSAGIEAQKKWLLYGTNNRSEYFGEDNWEKYKDANKTSHVGPLYSPLDWAIHHGDLPTIKRLVDLGVDLSFPIGQCGMVSGCSYVQNHPFCVAIFEENLEVIEYLLQEGARFSHESDCSFKMLVELGNTAYFQKFLDQCSDGAILANRLFQALSWGIHEEITTKVISTIKANGFKCDPESLRFAWDKAVKKDDILKAKFLLEMGATPDYFGDSFPVLAHAIDFKSTKIIDCLLEYGRGLDTCSEWGTPLMHALINGDITLFKRLLDLGALQNKVGDCVFGCGNLLHYAVRRDKGSNFLQLLVSAGADVNTRCDICPTALWIAAKHENVEAIQFLAKNGADVNSANHFGMTPVQWAFKTHREDAYETFMSLSQTNEAFENLASFSTSQCIQESVRSLCRSLSLYLVKGYRFVEDSRWGILAKCFYLVNDLTNALFAIKQITGHDCDICGIPNWGLFAICKDGADSDICQIRCEHCMRDHLHEFESNETKEKHHMIKVSGEGYRDVSTGVLALEATLPVWLEDLAANWTPKDM